MTAHDRANAIVSMMGEGRDLGSVEVDAGWLLTQIGKAIREACDEREQAVRNSIAHEVARRLGIFERYPDGQ